MVNETLQRQVADILKRFYQTDKVEGRVRAVFEVPQRVEDSDGNSVIDVYLHPLDERARHSFSGRNFLHIELLSGGWNPGLLGYDYIATVKKPMFGREPDIHIEDQVLSGNPKDPAL